jgi:hypothetical protein
MEKKWDTVTPADMKRLFLSGTYTYVPLVTKGLMSAQEFMFLIQTVYNSCHMFILFILTTFRETLNVNALGYERVFYK